MMQKSINGLFSQNSPITRLAVVAFLLCLSTTTAAMEIKEVKQKKVCVIEKIPVNCAYLAHLIRQQMKRCEECKWKTKEL